MPRTLLLCFIHGFKGDGDTFQEFPQDLKTTVGKQLPDHRVESVVYPKYETKGELNEATAAFLEWLKGRVMDIRKETCESPWPPSDNNVGVVLVAHSMGGFVAAESLFLALNERAANPNSNDMLFPLIQGILTFDTPYNGLARSMFVYGAFSNYQKVSTVFNAMTALSAAAPATLSRLGTRSAATSTIPATGGGPKWTTWQLLAVRTGTVGAIAAGGVAAYMHRESIVKGVQNVKNINRESIAKGYRQSVESVGQGLAYINRGNVGKSLAWLSDHFTFVGALLKPKELNRRLGRLGELKGVGLHDFYCSLGENGYWSGGYFVPERTFCAVPEPDHAAFRFFARRLMPEANDEIQAHMNLFTPEKHEGYEAMVDESAELVKAWFLSEDSIIDDPKFQEKDEEVAVEDSTVDKALEKGVVEGETQPGDDATAAKSDLPDESPIDIAAASSLVPKPGAEGEEQVANGNPEQVDADDDQRRTYMQYLFQVAERAGTGAKDWWPSKVPNLTGMPSIPNMPNMSASVSSLGQSMPGVNIFTSKKQASDKTNVGHGQQTGEIEGKEGQHVDDHQASRDMGSGTKDNNQQERETSAEGGAANKDSQMGSGQTDSGDQRNEEDVKGDTGLRYATSS